MKEYKVIKAFAAAEKGDILTYNEDTELWEFDITDENNHRYMCMDEDTADTFVEEGNLLVIDTKEEDECCDKLCRIADLINSLLEQYAEDNKAIAEKYEAGEIQPCVKVEADTVHYNLTKVLNRIKEEIEK